MSVFDLHVHTVKGSSDSSLSPEDLVVEALRLGLDGVCLTEHSGWRDLQEFKAFAARQELVVVHALEVDTVYGHVLAFGVDAYGPGFSNVRELRRAVHRAGGYLVTAHAFRNIFNPPPYNRSIVFADPGAYPKTATEALAHPVFHMVDDVEVFNGANTERENGFALEVARSLGERGTGGSDAHSTEGIGSCITVFDGPIRSEADLLEALRAGAYRPVDGFPQRELPTLDEESLEVPSPVSHSPAGRRGARHA